MTPVCDLKLTQHPFLVSVDGTSGPFHLVPAGDWQSHVASFDWEMVQAACEGAAEKGNNAD